METPYKNPQCPVCTDRLRLQLTEKWYGPRMEEVFDFSDGLKKGWRLELFFHGRTTASDVVVSDIHLDGVSEVVRSLNQLPIYHVQSPAAGRDIGLSAILGSVERFEDGAVRDRIVPEIRTDRFLVFGLRDGAFFRPQVPLVHMITRFVTFE